MIKKIVIYYSVFVGLIVALGVFSVGGLEDSLAKKISWLYPTDKFDSEMTLSLKISSKENICNLEHCSPIKIYFTKVSKSDDDLILYSKENYQVNKVIEAQNILIDSSLYKEAITKKLYKEISATTPKKLIEAMRVTVLNNYWFDIVIYFVLYLLVTIIGVYFSNRSKKKR